MKLLRLKIILSLYAVTIVIILFVKNPLSTIQKSSPDKEESTFSTAQITSEDMAISAVKKRISELNPQDRPFGVDTDCVFYLGDDVNSDFFQVEIREKHSEAEGCPGDPQTMPSISLFKVSKDNGKIWKYDLIQDNFSAY